MKKLFVLLMTMLCIHSISEAQSSSPLMVKEGKKWVYYKYGPIASEYWYFPTIYEFEGDTLLGGGVKYKKLYEDIYFYITKETSEEYIPEGCTYGYNHMRNIVAFFREEGSKVYVRPVPYRYYLPIVGCISNLPLPRIESYEYIVYDWSYEAEEWFKQVPLSVYDRENFFTFTGKTDIEINGVRRACYSTSAPCRKMIEGIGYVQTNWESTAQRAQFTNFFHLIPRATHVNNPMERFIRNGEVLSHVIEDGEIVFKGEMYEIFQEKGLNPDKPIGSNTAVEELPVVTTGDGGTYYDMQGRAVSAPIQPGIYIKDGQKVIVK